jgi:hypothetical protein
MADLKMRIMNGGETALEETTVEQLADSLRGDIIAPGRRPTMRPGRSKTP